MLVLSSRPAEACSCCGASTTRRLVGWTEAGGAVALEFSSDAACELRRAIEVWHAGSAAPAGCYDLFRDPDRRVACDAIEWERLSASAKPASDRIRGRFATRPALPASRVRLRKQRPDPQSATLQLEVEVEVGGTWTRVWHGMTTSRETVSRLDGRVEPMPLEVTLWPSPRGDRGLLLLENVPRGSNFETEVHWVALPR
jgi:hypothetical protein